MTAKITIEVTVGEPADKTGLRKIDIVTDVASDPVSPNALEDRIATIACDFVKKAFATPVTESAYQVEEGANTK